MHFIGENPTLGPQSNNTAVEAREAYKEESQRKTKRFSRDPHPTCKAYHASPHLTSPQPTLPCSTPSHPTPRLSPNVYTFQAPC